MMKSRTFPAVCGALALGVFPSPVLADTATSLSSFEGREEPTVVYQVSSGTFRNDSFTNITSPSSGTFRFFLRYRSNQWWDGDRNTSNNDRQRAEVKGLGGHQKTGQVFEYATTWRTNSSFRGSGKFCHFFQLKATDGDNGAPLVVASIHSGQSSASVRYWPGNASTFLTARNVSWSPATWQTLNIRIKTSNSSTANGEVRASVNGGSMSGVTNVRVYRPGSTDYRPKWGLYRGVSNGMSIGDDYVEHRNVSANRR